MEWNWCDDLNKGARTNIEKMSRDEEGKRERESKVRDVAVRAGGESVERAIWWEMACVFLGRALTHFRIHQVWENAEDAIGERNYIVFRLHYKFALESIESDCVLEYAWW